jgi:pyridoxamine 5'-phosphate oxidase-like protein
MPTTLPEWPLRTIAVLTTLDPAADHQPHAIPVSAPVRAGDHAILLSLHRSRDSLARLRAHPRVALLILAEGNTVLTARGTAHVIEEAMPGALDYAAVRNSVTDVDDHRQAAFTVEAGADRRWIDQDEQKALGRRVTTLQRLARP